MFEDFDSDCEGFFSLDSREYFWGGIEFFNSYKRGGGLVLFIMVVVLV